MSNISTLIEWQWYDFTPTNLTRVPSAAGVYALGINDSVIYYGGSDDLNRRLHDHYYTSDSCISHASQFAFIRQNDWESLEWEKLVGFIAQTGDLPPCNDRL